LLNLSLIQFKVFLMPNGVMVNQSKLDLILKIIIGLNMSQKIKLTDNKLGQNSSRYLGRNHNRLLIYLESY
jgi:hypothetical protein